MILEIRPARRVRQVADVDPTLLAGSLGRLERLVVLPRATVAAATAAVVCAAVPRRPVVIAICGCESARCVVAGGDVQLGALPQRGPLVATPSARVSGRCGVERTDSRRPRAGGRASANGRESTAAPSRSVRAQQSRESARDRPSRTSRWRPPSLARACFGGLTTAQRVRERAKVEIAARATFPRASRLSCSAALIVAAEEL